MIAAWMVTASLVALLAAVAAACGEQVLRALGRPVRGAWAAAIAASVAWPAVASLLTGGGAAAGVAVLPPIRVTQLVPSPLTQASAAWMPRVDRLLLSAWVGASLLRLLWLAVGMANARRVRRRATRGEVAGVAVLVSGEAGPAVVGLRHPRIIYPRALLDLDLALQSVIVRHEEEHRRAHDAWLAFGCSLALVVMPWSPALWWMTRRARLALEIDCDARVLRAHRDPVQYGKLLLLVSQAGPAERLVPALVSSRTHLERRIRAMLSQHPTHRGIRIALGTIGLVTASVAASSARVSSGSVDTPVRAAAARDTGEVPRKGPDGSYFEFQVERPVRQLPGAIAMHYPEEMKATKQEGEVLAQFVVDTSGVLVPGTFKVLRSTNVAFTNAVRDALPGLRFEPARIGGRAVKQVVQQPFTFSLTKR